MKANVLTIIDQNNIQLATPQGSMAGFAREDVDFDTGEVTAPPKPPAEPDTKPWTKPWFARNLKELRSLNQLREAYHISLSQLEGWVAENYFGKDILDLTEAQLEFLTATIQNGGTFTADLDPDDVIEMQVTKHYRGCYRVRNGGELFGQVKHNDIPNAETGSVFKGWLAEIRYTDTGAIKEYAGIWDTKRDAVAEAERILSRG